MKFVLQECKVRGNILVPRREPPFACSWPELIERLGVAKDRAVEFLAGARKNGHLGVRATEEGPAVFYVETPGGRGDLHRLMSDEAIATIQAVYRVEAVDREVSRYEASGESSFEPVCVRGSSPEAAAS
jgi:hypothetical protein